MQISWEVRNRFRLFREERDFLLQVDAGRGRSVLATEQALSVQSDGRGWARNTVGRLCIDVNGRVAEPCTRDNVKESYLTPTDHPVTVRLTGQVAPEAGPRRPLAGRSANPAPAVSMKTRRVPRRESRPAAVRVPEKTGGAAPAFYIWRR